MHGCGVEGLLNGDRREGQWRRGQPDDGAEWTIWYKDSSMFRGQCVGGVPQVGRS
jgi:hypothetical protein